MNQSATRKLSTRNGTPPLARKILIIDDFHKCKFRNRKGQSAVLELARSFFDTVIVFASDLFRFQELAKKTDEPSPFAEFRYFTIRELGHYLRRRLIKRWVNLGQEFTQNEVDLSRDVTEYEKLVDTVLGKNILPSHPITILTLVQTWEAGKGHDMKTGSYGYLYEALITEALQRVNSDSADIDIKYTYVSRIAFYLFSRDQSAITTDELTDLNQEYLRLYDISVDERRMLEELEASSILFQMESNYRFKYKYIYYYFVARYFKDNIGAEGLREMLGEMADRVYYEPYAHVLMFYLYLTKDADVIDALVRNAELIYANHEPLDLDQHVDFVNKIYKQATQLVLPATNPEENRERVLKKLDETEQEDDEDSLILAEDDVTAKEIKYDEELADILKINISFKTLQIIGQVLRNFPGSLKGDIKLRIATQSYMLGLRTGRCPKNS